MIRMHRRISTLMALAGAFTLGSAGCTLYGPQPYWELNKVEAQFKSKNFKVVATGLQGTASTTYVLPIVSTVVQFISPEGGGGQASGFPLGDPAILEKAMGQLRDQASPHLLGRPAFMHNLSFEWSMSGPLMLYGEQTVTVTADVVEFTGPKEKE